MLFETAGIGNPIMAAQNWYFINRCNKRPIATVSKNASIGSPIVAFYNCCYKLGLSFFLINLIFETILSRYFKNDGIWLSYPSALNTLE